MSNILKGKGVLITGGSGGFGSMISRRLLADGASVTLMGRTEATLVETTSQLASELDDPARVNWIVGDAGEPDDVQAAVARVADLSIVVCTVGGGTMAPLMALEPSILMGDFRRNVVTALNAIRQAVPTLVQNGGGSVVCTSSTAGGFSQPFMGSYSVAKSALEALVRVAADELGRHEIRVNAVRPGLVPTKAAKPGILATDPEQREAVLREKPLGRVGRPEDIAEAVRFLAGPESSWVTGVVLPVEGGNHLRRAADLEKLARSMCGDDIVDTALRGQLPGAGA